MKKYVCSILCVLFIFGLCSCDGKVIGGNVSGVKTHEVASKLYSQEDITSAINVIKAEFKLEWNGCTLTEIYYAGDETTKNEQKYYEVTSQLQRHNADEVIVLTSSFDVDSSRGDGSLDPNSTYDGWNWILVRKNGGLWRHVDHGYG